MSGQSKSFCLEDFARPEVLAMKGYVPGEQPQGGKFIKLNTNENPYPPSAKALSAIADLGPNLRKYPDPSASAFRQQAATLYGVTSDQILCGNGSDEILSLICRLFLKPGSIVRWPVPTYLVYQTLAESCGSAIDGVPFENDWTLPEAFYAGSPQLVFIANPNSPSGSCFYLEELDQIIGRFDCPVVVDEAYADFAGQTAATLLGKHQNLIVTRTLSKSYALAGLRFGFLMANQPIVSQLHKLRDSYNCDMLSIAIATSAVADQDWLKSNVGQIIKDREELAESLRDLGFDVQPSQANFLWCRHSEIPAQSIYSQLKERHILIRMMDYGDPFIGVRITVGTPEQNQVLVDQLKQIVTDCVR